MVKIPEAFRQMTGYKILIYMFFFFIVSIIFTFTSISFYIFPIIIIFLIISVKLGKIKLQDNDFKNKNEELQDREEKISFKKIIEIVKKDKFIRTLLLSNIFIALLAIYQQWDPFELIFGYFIQNIVIGFFTVVEILSLKKYSTDGLLEMHFFSPATQPPVNTKTKIYATSFIVPYLIFNFIIFNFILAAYYIVNNTNGFDIPEKAIYVFFPVLFIFEKMKIIVLIIFLSHLLEYFYDKARESNYNKKEIPLIKDILDRVDGRVVVLFFIAWSSFALSFMFDPSDSGKSEVLKYFHVVLFLFLKTGLDIMMYLRKNIFKNNPTDRPQFL